MEAEFQEHLQDKFPGIQPIRSAPNMSTVNGIGTKLYGKRDFDSETGAYISTLCFCVVFIPVYALSSYVVVDAEKEREELEDHFLGRSKREPGTRARSLRVKGRGKSPDAARSLAVRESKLPIKTRVRLGKKLVSRFPNKYTMELYLDLLFEKAHELLKAGSKHYEKAVRQGLYKLTKRQLLALALLSSSESSAAVENSPAFQKARKLLKKYFKGFPRQRSATSWVYFRKSDSAQAASVAEFIRNDREEQLRNKLAPLLFGDLDTVLFEGYLNALASKNQKLVRRYGSKLRRRGYKVQKPK